MKSFSAFLVFLCLWLPEILQAQTLFEGEAGQTSINLPLGGITRLNTADGSLKIGYYYNRSDKDIVLGVDATGQSNNGFAPLVSQRKLSPEAGMNLNIGFKNVTTSDARPSGYDYLNVKIGFGEARYQLIDVDAAYDDQIYAKSFTKFNAGLSYNYVLHGNMIFGAYAGYNHTNNISSLYQLTIKESSSLSSAAGASTIRTSEVEYTAWQGPFRAVDQFSLYLDYVYIPDFLNNRVALSAYSRSGFNTFQNITNGGFGLYLNRKGDPLKIVGGLLYEFEDIFNYQQAGTSFNRRGTLGIIVGYNF